MANLFDITVPSVSITLDSQRQAIANFTVTNTTNRRLRGTATIVTVPAESPARAWIVVLQPDGRTPEAPNTYRDFPIQGRHTYQVRVAVPLDAAPGSYKFKLRMAEELNPDDETRESTEVLFVVEPPAVPPPPPPPPPKIPIWAIIAAVVVVLLVIGGVIFLLTRGSPARPILLSTMTGVLRIDPSRDPVQPETFLPADNQFNPPSYAVYAQDGQHVLFAQSQQFQIVDLEGNSVFNVPFADQVRDLAWSPSPTWLAYSRRLQSRQELQVRFFQRDGTQFSSTTACVLGGQPPAVNAPTWSPDGRFVAVYQGGFSNGTIVRFDLEGVGEVGCTTVPQTTLRPADYVSAMDWSPDGSRLAYSEVPGGPNTNRSLIQILSLAASNQQPQLLVELDYFVESLRYSPDGRQIAAVGCRHVGEFERPCQLELIDASSGSRRTLHSFVSISNVITAVDW